MNRTQQLAMSLVVLLSAVVYGCKLDDITAEDFRSGDPGTNAGTLTVSMTTPHVDDGAIRFTITGPFVTTPRAASPGHRVFTLQRSPQELDVVVVGDLESGAILILPVRDTEVAPEYQAIITEVADRTGSLRADSNGYSTQVLRSAQ